VTLMGFAELNSSNVTANVQVDILMSSEMWNCAVCLSEATSGLRAHPRLIIRSFVA
jgi:hypothetical protein